jgi:tRNA threonylcarbamoyladenosine biosynthesis protein TsaB
MEWKARQITIFRKVMTTVLAIETATEACSAALHHNGEVTKEYVVAPQQHANLLLPMCDTLLKQAGIKPSQLSAVAFGRGPGSFTGVRIASAVAQGIAVANDVPLIAVSSLQALAQEVYLKYQCHKVLTAIDARMQEVYWGAFILHDGLMQLKGEERVAKVEVLPTIDSMDWFAAGTGWQSYAETLNTKYANNIYQTDAAIFPSADAVLLLAVKLFDHQLFIQPEQAIPVYLRNDIVAKS